MSPTSKRTRVIVLFGGPSVERDVSRISARTIVSGFDPARYEVLPISIDAQGRFESAVTSQKLLAGAPPERFEPEKDGASTRCTTLIPAEIAPGVADVVFPIVHGTMGEDGLLQGFLETLGIPYVGPGVLGSALGMDKAVFKAVMRDAGIPVTRGIVVRAADWQQRGMALLEEIREALPLPLFVKPANGGSSVGVTKVKSMADLEAGIVAALRYDRTVLVEEGIDAREIECAVLGSGEMRASVCGEIIPGHEFYDYEDKYIDTGSRAVIPADLPAPVSDQIRALAIRAVHAASIEGMARVDFFVEKGTNRIFLNEVNTLPGFTSISMYPKLWEATGVPLSELLDELVKLALERAGRTKTLRAQLEPPKHLG